jgi:hypothetical protein
MQACQDWNSDNGAGALDDSMKRRIFLKCQVRARLADRIYIFLNPIDLNRWLGRMDGHAESTAETQAATDDHFITLTIPVRLKRGGKEMKLIVEDGSDPITPDASLVRVLVRAHNDPGSNFCGQKSHA